MEGKDCFIHFPLPSFLPFCFPFYFCHWMICLRCGNVMGEGWCCSFGGSWPAVWCLVQDHLGGYGCLRNPGVWKPALPCRRRPLSLPAYMMTRHSPFLSQPIESLQPSIFAYCLCRGGGRGRGLIPWQLLTVKLSVDTFAFLSVTHTPPPPFLHFIWAALDVIYILGPFSCLFIRAPL